MVVGQNALWLVSVGILPRSRGAATRLVERGGGPVMCLTRPLSSRGSLSSPWPFAWSFTERVVARTFLWVPWSVVVPTAACECSVNSLPIQCARASSLLLSLPGVSARKDPHSPCSVQPKCLLFQHYTTLEMFIVPAAPTVQRCPRQRRARSLKAIVPEAAPLRTSQISLWFGRSCSNT